MGTFQRAKGAARAGNPWLDCGSGQFRGSSAQLCLRGRRQQGKTPPRPVGDQGGAPQSVSTFSGSSEEFVFSWLNSVDSSRSQHGLGRRAFPDPHRQLAIRHLPRPPRPSESSKDADDRPLIHSIQGLGSVPCHRAPGNSPRHHPTALTPALRLAATALLRLIHGSSPRNN